ncbi:putative aldouronate transport system substrate-binding protein [Paenibacillus sp. UNCCL117]|uniref:extracellular solute-binding protein n=1 Tax=unclassified Paenibacillus TaxID=185978 RepID=UPI0008912AEA|nr:MULTISPECIES: extracellular solute-binding protein [unclassified Paenibacillus]SDD38330.1 putative aldouronate transport system substrate-binding protein [Paenibacillus sp. cl123]SFW48598.1 putative aldouronate transport system substrate-binding protein [Paenibacillus sp. UNCCL117]
MDKRALSRRAAVCRIWAILLLAICLLGGCTAGSSPSEGQQEGEKPVVSIMAPLHFPHSPKQELIREIEKLTNTKLEIEWVSDGIYTDKMNTALTTNSMKKVTYVKYTDYLLLKSAVRSGSFWEIGPYLGQYPNLKQLNKEILRQSAVDGKVYGLYTERPSSRQGIIIREDWLENLQLDKPGTIQELYEVMRRFTYDDPDRNGKQDTVGLTDRNDLVFGAFKTLSSYFGTPNNWTIAGNQLIPEFETKAYMDTMNFVKRLYEEKIINRDFAVTSKEVQRDQLIRGTAGVYIGSMTDVQRLSDEAKAMNPKARFTLVNRIQGPEGYRVWSIPNYSALYLFSKKAIKTEEELKAILAFFDRTMDKDVANLMRYGVQDVHYKLENGKVVLPEETSQLRASEVNGFYALMIADLSNPNVLEIAKSTALSGLADQLVEDNESFIVKDPMVNVESKTYDEKSIELFKIISDATYNYMLGHLDEAGFRQEIAKWKRSGGKQVMEEYAEAYFRNNN